MSIEKQTIEHIADDHIQHTVFRKDCPCNRYSQESHISIYAHKSIELSLILRNSHNMGNYISEQDEQKINCRTYPDSVQKILM